MKKLSFLLLSLVALTTTFVSCSKDEAAPAAPVTSIELTITDAGTGEIVPDALVSLYSGPTSESLVQTLTADANGKVKFTGLKTNIVYEFDAGLGCKTNTFDKKKADGVLTAGTNTKYTVKIQPIGVILLKNTSTTDTFTLQIAQKSTPDNKVPMGEIKAGQQGPIPAPVGEWIITATNKTNTADIVRTYDAPVTCGGTVNVNIPN